VGSSVARSYDKDVRAGQKDAVALRAERSFRNGPAPPAFMLCLRAPASIRRCFYARRPIVDSLRSKSEKCIVIKDLLYVLFALAVLFIPLGFAWFVLSRTARRR
jgi:hypothetical protein